MQFIEYITKIQSALFLYSCREYIHTVFYYTHSVAASIHEDGDGRRAKEELCFR